MTDEHDRLLLKRARRGERPNETGVLLFALSMAGLIAAGMVATFA